MDDVLLGGALTVQHGDLLAEAEEAILPPSDPPKPPDYLMAATRSLYDPTGTALMLQQWTQEGRLEHA